MVKSNVRHREEVEAIRAIARTRRRDDLASLCDEMQTIAARSTRSERAAIYLLDEGASELVMGTTPYGYAGELSEQHRRGRLDGPIMGEVVQTLTPVAFGLEKVPEPYRRASAREGFVEYAVVPLHSEGVLTGTLNLARTRAEPYDADTVELALVLGEQISVQVERARLYVEERERAGRLAALNEDLRRSYEDLARAQTELLRKERLANLGELAVMVAHEVRNPLGVIFNVVSQLRKFVPQNPPVVPQLLEILQEEAARLDPIVKGFLQFGRPSSPQLRLVDIEDLVDTAIAQTTRTLTNAHMQWRVDISVDTPRLQADEHLLGEALVSLFTNAAESQAMRGVVSVKTSRCQHDGREHVCLSVEDEGVSVPRESVEHVFEPFFTTKTFGTGLGLSLVKRTVEAHAGHVSIGPRERGGTVVTLMLPLQAH